MSNYNKITYKGRNILDEDIAIGGLTNNLMLYQALISEELKPDTFIFHLAYDKGKLVVLKDSNGKYLLDSNGKLLVAKADSFDPENFRFGDPLTYYVNNGSTLVGKYYVKSVTRVARRVYRFECISAIGLLTYRGHNGGMYNTTLGNVIAEIMDDIPYTIDADLADVTVSGPLPKVQAARDNLLALLFMSGGSVKKAANGNINFGYIGSGSAKTILDTNLDVSGSISYLAPATRVEVTAHEFHNLQDDEEVTLYDNTGGVAADHLVVDFQDPCHDLVAVGLTIDSSNANYAIVSGVGTLTGKKYTHTTSVYAINTGVNAEPNVIQVTDNMLINPGNVANVAKRISNYYGIAKEVDYLMRVTNERPGDKVTFKDPWGDQQTGFIKEMNVQLSKRLNANTKIALNWTPGPFGDSYSNYKIFRASDISSGTLTIPVAMRGAQALIVLLSGAGGGQGGFNGEQGHASGSGVWSTGYAGKPAAGGDGGAPGQPGERGRIISFYVNSLPASYSNAAIGVGGAGGAPDGGLGSPGGDTTLDIYSTQDGAQLIDDYTNFLTGEAYGTLNIEGESGDAGGIGSGHANSDLDTSTNGSPHTCESGTWNGGSYINGWSRTKTVSSGKQYHYAAGGGGGGAAHGADGNAATNDYDTYDWHTVGGAGADAVAPPQAAETQAGRGGHGGGGGGGGASGYVAYSYSSYVTYDWGDGGPGGSGSYGGQGGDGLIIVYYNPAA